jgi:hypothetical protein
MDLQEMDGVDWTDLASVTYGWGLVVNVVTNLQVS